MDGPPDALPVGRPAPVGEAEGQAPKCRDEPERYAARLMTELRTPVSADVHPDPRDRAFVVFLMFNDSYLPGALTAAYGLLQQHSRSRRVCVVTPEITPEARGILSELYDQVVEVSPIAAPDDSTAADPNQIRTGSARVKSAALTRFASLRLGPDGDLGCSYQKVVVIDADLLPLRDFDELWSLPAPAGIINEHRGHMAEIDEHGRLVVRPESLATGRWVWHDIYDPVCPHGSPIPAELTDRVAVDHSNYGVNASLVVVEPSMETYDDFMRWVSAPDIRELVHHRWPWIDQQAATLYWSGRWTNVDVSFSTLYGYPSLDLARGLHFAGVKPWSWRKKGFARRLDRFPDYRRWAEVYLDMMRSFPRLNDHTGLRRIARELEAALEAVADS